MTTTMNLIRTAADKVALAHKTAEACFDALDDSAAAFTCGEAEIMAEFLTAFIGENHGQSFLDSHRAACPDEYEAE